MRSIPTFAGTHNLLSGQAWLLQHGVALRQEPTAATPPIIFLWFLPVFQDVLQQANELEVDLVSQLTERCNHEEPVAQPCGCHIHALGPPFTLQGLRASPLLN